MIYMHENNINEKIRVNYKGKSQEIKNFFDEIYSPMRKEVEKIDFENDKDAFVTFAEKINNYDSELSKFEKQNEIASQSKFKSSFYEEISCYLFAKLPRITSGEMEVFNKGICIGLKLDMNDHIIVEKKDVDFCIGQNVKIDIAGQKTLTIKKPIVAVEVKTYTDATMFGEIQNTSKLLRNGSPYANTYVLMGYRAIADDHLVAAKYIPVNQMYALRKNSQSEMLASVFEEYYKEVRDYIASYGSVPIMPSFGGLLKR